LKIQEEIYYTSSQPFCRLRHTPDVTKGEGFAASVLIFDKKVDVHRLLHFFIKYGCGKLKNTICKKGVFRHYVNVTERGLAHDWPNVQR
jgi:hypothetical protein